MGTDIRPVGDDALNEAVKRLAENFKPQKIILFGSRARGTGDARSDFDLLIICDVKENRRALMIKMDRALRGLGLARDIVILTPEEFERDRRAPGTIARPASREGKVLYERLAG